MNVRRVAALPSSQNLTEPPVGDEPRVVKGRRGGTDEFPGRGISVPQSPWSSGQGGRPLEKGLVQLHADAVGRKSQAAVSEPVNSSPVGTPRKKEKPSAVCGAPVDSRGHISVRLDDLLDTCSSRAQAQESQTTHPSSPGFRACLFG